MSSARIDFEGQYGGLGCCAQQPIQISKTKPAILDEHMTSVAWMSFCDRIDTALHPLNKLRRFAGYSTFVFVMAFILVPVILMITSINRINNFDSSYESPNIVAFIIGPLVAMSGLIFTQCFIARKANSVMEDLKSICDEVSKQQPRLSFHVRFERHYYHRSSDNTSSHTTNYIEVIVAGDSAVVPYATAVEPVIPYPTAPEMEYPSFAGNVSSDKKSPAERLATLEAMKPYLSDKEYSEKRTEILDGV